MCNLPAWRLRVYAMSYNRHRKRLDFSSQPAARGF
jgi:hypothetical protein